MLQLQFRLINNKFNNYYIIIRKNKKFLGINGKNRIIFYKNNEAIDHLKISWKLIKVYENKFMIKNCYNNKFIEAKNTILKCINNPIYTLNNFYKNKYTFYFRYFKII